MPRMPTKSLIRMWRIRSDMAFTLRTQTPLSLFTVIHEQISSDYIALLLMRMEKLALSKEFCINEKMAYSMEIQEGRAFSWHIARIWAFWCCLLSNIFIRCCDERSSMQQKYHDLPFQSNVYFVIGDLNLSSYFTVEPAISVEEVSEMNHVGSDITLLSD